MKDDPTPPPAPDPAATAGAQSQSNIATAIANARLNRVNQQTPWGSITYTEGPPDANGVPTWSSNVNLSPEQQQLLQQQQAMQLQRGQMGQNFLSQIPQGPLDLGSLPGINNRGQMYNGPPPVAQGQPQGGQQQGPPQGQPPPQSGPQGPLSGAGGIEQAIAAAIAAATGQAPPQGQPQGQQPQAPQAPGYNGPTYQDYKNYTQQFNSSENGTNNFGMDEAQWGQMSPLDQWGAMGGGQILGRNDPRYQGLFAQTGGEENRPLSVIGGQFDPNALAENGENQMVKPYVDPSQVYQGDGFYAHNPSNETAELQRRGGMSDKDWALLAAALAAGGYGATAFAGAGAGAGADLSLMSALPETTIGGLGETAALGAPVTDLSVQAANPSLWQQATTNFSQGRGLLGMNRGVSSAAGLLPQLLRRKPGGSQ